MHVPSTPLWGPGGDIEGAVETFSDNTAALAATQRLEELSRELIEDRLTDVGNRRFLDMKLRSCHYESQITGRPFGVLSEHPAIGPPREMGWRRVPRHTHRTVGGCLGGGRREGVHARRAIYAGGGRSSGGSHRVHRRYYEPARRDARRTSRAGRRAALSGERPRAERRSPRGLTRPPPAWRRPWSDAPPTVWPRSPRGRATSRSPEAGGPRRLASRGDPLQSRAGRARARRE